MLASEEDVSIQGSLVRVLSLTLHQMVVLWLEPPGSVVGPTFLFVVQCLPEFPAQSHGPQEKPDGSEQGIHFSCKEAVRKVMWREVT